MKEGKLVFMEGGLMHAVSASVHLVNDYQVTILCLNQQKAKGENKIDYQGVKIVSLGRSQWLKNAQFGSWSFFGQAWQYIKKEKPDVLIGNNLFAAFLVRFFPIKAKKIGIIHHLYSGLFGIKKQNLSTRLIKLWEGFALPFLLKLDAIGTVNPLVVEILEKKGFSKSKTVVVANGVDLSFYNFQEEKNLKEMVYLGRIAELKGVEDLIEVAAELRKSFPDVLLHLVGSGPKEEFIKNKVKRLNLEGSVVFHGYLGEIEKIKVLNRAAFYVSASQLEGFGIPLVEAMAKGCVPIVSDIYAHRFIFQDRPVGFLAKDNKGMVEKISYLFNNEKARKDMAREGRQLVEKMWTWEQVGKNYKKLLNI